VCVLLQVCPVAGALLQVPCCRIAVAGVLLQVCPVAGVSCCSYPVAGALLLVLCCTVPVAGVLLQVCPVARVPVARVPVASVLLHMWPVADVLMHKVPLQGGFTCDSSYHDGLKRADSRRLDWRALYASDSVHRNGTQRLDQMRELSAEQRGGANLASRSNKRDKDCCWEGQGG